MSVQVAVVCVPCTSWFDPLIIGVSESFFLPEKMKSEKFYSLLIH